MKMTKMVSLLLVCLMLVGLFCGCNNSNEDDYTWSEVVVTEVIKGENSETVNSGDTTNNSTTVNSGDTSNNSTPVNSGNTSNNSTPVNSGNTSNNSTPVNSGDTSNNSTPVNSGNTSNNSKPVNSGNTSNNSKPVNSGNTSNNSTPVNSGNTSNNSKPVNSGNTTNNAESTTSQSSTNNSKPVSSNNETNVSSNTSSLPEENTDIPEKFTKLNYKGKTIKVLIWYEPQGWEKKIYDEFEEMTGCKFKFYQLGTSTMLKKLTAMVSAGSAPDVVALDENNYIPCVSSKLIQPIDTYVDKSDYWIDWNISEGCKYADSFYGVTSNLWGDNIFVYFNKTLFKKSTAVNKTPLDYYNSGEWTWEIFAELAEKMTVKNSSGVVTQRGCQSNLYNTFARSAGGSLVEYKNGEFINTINSEPIKKAALFEKNLLEKGYISYNTDTWASGNVAMLINPQYQVRDPKLYKYNFEWDWVPFPKYTGGNSYQPISIQMGAVPVKSKNVEEAYNFISWRCFCTTTMRTMKESSTNVYMDRYRKAMENATKYSVDAAPLGRGIYNIYQALIKPNSDIQSTIDAYSPQIDEAIDTLKKTMASYK